MTDFVKKKIVEKLAKSVENQSIVPQHHLPPPFHRFTKDLKPSDISLAVLTGKGVLTNLELNCDFITEALQLPPWIRVARVMCDRIRAHVPFTNLRNDPIVIVSGCDCPLSVCFNNILLVFKFRFHFHCLYVEYWYRGD